jgi:DNA-directed RNA polymerase subunit RPC12/RpoP
MVEHNKKLNSSTMPIMKTYSCLNCGQTVTKSNTAGKYCSNACQHKHIRNNKVETNKASSVTMKRYLIETSGYRCSECGIDSWNNKPISLELEHKNGNSSDNSLENVCLLCPNCHSQTSTYKAKNKGNGRYSRRMRYSAGLSY